MKRRLAAILAADAVAFSAFASRDERAAIRALKGHVGAIEPLIGINSGRIVKGTGDGFLAEFGSVVDAVACAEAAQRLMAERNADQPEGSRLHFRMGIHVGDIVIDGEDILGDGVNIAARLEGVAPPGGVAVSARVHEDVAGKLDLVFDDLGPRELKNIARPIHVFALGAAGARPAPAPVALPDKPSVAVLPFANMSRAEEDDYFADGVTEDIITALSYVPWLFVIARNSSFVFRGLNVDIRKVGQELGVRYVLEGSVRRAGGRLRVTGQLIDAETGAHIWADRYDGEVEDVFDLQDRISESVVNAIAPEIRHAEIARGLRKPVSDLDAYDHYLRGLNELNKFHREEARVALARAIALAPDFAKAMAVWAWISTTRQIQTVVADHAESDEALLVAERALEFAPDDAEVLAYAGYTVGFYGRNPGRGLMLIDRALKLCPSFAWAWVSSALMSDYAGDPDAAIEKAHYAMRLSPRDPLAFRAHIALSLAHLAKGDFESVLVHATAGADMNPRAYLFHRYIAVALHKLGRREEARRMRDRHLAEVPSFRVEPYIEHNIRRAGVNERMLSAMRQTLLDAGFPP